MRWGYEMCDGRLDLKDCTSCVLHRHGLNKTHSKMLSALPPVVGKMLGRARLSGSYWTALRMSELVQLRHSVYRNLISEVDHVVALCQWTEDLLIDHGVPSEKITVSHHGLTQVTGNNYKKLAKPSSGSGKLRIAFMGRLDRTKGVDVIIRALRELPGLKAELDVYGVAQELNGNDYLRKLRLIAADDSRFNFRSPIHSDQAISCLDEYDLLAVPSRTFETGPLVVLEAFAAGIPVIGSNLGGIAELVEHEVNGLLVETDSITEWKSALQRCASEGGLLDRLRAGVRPPRSMATVAGEMMTLYKRLLMAGSRERRPFS
jgi:glycosyltransferase involved in cell wall biosynthesis